MGGIFFCFLGGLGLSHPPRIQLKTTAEPIGLYPKEQNPIRSVVTEILSFRRTDGQTDIVLLCIIDNYSILEPCIQKQSVQRIIWKAHTLKMLNFTIKELLPTKLKSRQLDMRGINIPQVIIFFLVILLELFFGKSV